MMEGWNDGMMGEGCEKVIKSLNFFDTQFPSIPLFPEDLS
jgi:hypothetical protein